MREKPAAISIQSFTSSEAGAWSNAYLVSGRSNAILYDVPKLRNDANRLAEMIERSGKDLTTVMISHAHPDHFMGLDVITERFPRIPIVSTPNVVADIKQDGPRMLSLLQGKLGSEGPTKLVVPEPLDELTLGVDETFLEVVEFGEGESKHNATLYVSSLKALISADLVYNNAHLYLAERHLDSWLARLGELEIFATDKITTIYPGHGTAGGLAPIAETRRYLHDFATAVRGGDAQTAERQMMAKYTDHHARQFLTVFSIPAYFPSAAST